MDYNNLIVKFFSRDISDQEIALLKTWLEKDAANRILFDKANMLWQESNPNADIFNTDSGWNALAARIGTGQSKNHSVVIVNKFRYISFIAAASIIILLSIGGLSFLAIDRNSTKEILASSTTVSTNQGEKAGIYLSDSTYVLLNSGSRLSYTSGYNLDQRAVDFEGEAYFNVRPNKNKPFTVRLGKVTVSARGTKFNILSYPNENRIEATLEEGVIDVMAGNDLIEARPGQQVIYYNKTGKAELKDVNTEIYTSWRENKLRLIDTPLEEALRRIARRYNVTFEIRSRDLLDLKYTATFIDEPINEVMEMLKTVSPIEYRIYNRMTVDERRYLKPRIIIDKRTLNYKPEAYETIN
jgi:ferric-dicitrate binding protein FerR (iron transport regulator)